MPNYVIHSHRLYNTHSTHTYQIVYKIRERVSKAAIIVDCNFSLSRLLSSSRGDYVHTHMESQCVNAQYGPVVISLPPRPSDHINSNTPAIKNAGEESIIHRQHIFFTRDTPTQEIHNPSGRKDRRFVYIIERERQTAREDVQQYHTI